MSINFILIFIHLKWYYIQHATSANHLNFVSSIRKKASVVCVVEQLQTDTQESCSQIPVPFLTCKTTSAEDQAGVELCM